MDSGLDACASPRNDGVLCDTSDESLATARRANHLPILRNRRHSLAPRNAFRLSKTPARKNSFRQPFQSDHPRPDVSGKIFRFTSAPIRWLLLTSRLIEEGRTRRHERGGGMRWTQAVSPDERY